MESATAFKRRFGLPFLLRLLEADADPTVERPASLFATPTRHLQHPLQRGEMAARNAA